jgi:cation diffusion facilitator family transporter
MPCRSEPELLARTTAPQPDETEHEHQHGLLGKLRHLVGEWLGHDEEGHDEPDLSDALADSAGRRALRNSLIILGVTAVLQLVVALASSSVALLGDAVHNVADALTALPLFVAFAFSRRPASRRFTYGYGRSEDLAGLVILVVIAGSATVSAVSAVGRLLHPHPVDHLGAVAIAAVVGFLGNEVVARYRIRVGRRISSAALVADGLHARTDGFTSLAVLLGAAGVALGFSAADPLVGLFITVAILGVLRSAGREVLGRLLDSVDPAMVSDAEQAVASIPGVRSVDEIRIRWVGRVLRAEIGLALDGNPSLVEAHALAHHAEEHLLAAVPHLRAATVHVSPADAHHRSVPATA